MKNNYYDFCLHSYKAEYDKCLDGLKSKKSGHISEKILNALDREAQKTAIRVSFTQALNKFPNVGVAELWKAIYRSHLFRKSGISDLDTISKVISADQSWKKSSGHAFEEMVKELSGLALYGTDVDIILQRDLNTLIKAGELYNEPRDISWLKEQIKANIFDLFAIITVDGQKKCFGCVQAKTSIRDRVTRDREPSLHAMQSFFWSAVIVLDGDFLKMPKFVTMINGGSVEFPDNGWHGMYVLSADEQNDRIYPISMDFEIFKNHALQAAERWKTQRQWLDSSWKAE